MNKLNQVLQMKQSFFKWKWQNGYLLVRFYFQLFEDS
jgi:hypothetical protein